ncbi:MAG: Wzz/FepE/Etk N-terminal domain-containing protein [Thermodesulfovibrionales bacterium]|jgi:uncharacterized protein involved in exopolysaccharide biosynthesis
MNVQERPDDDINLMEYFKVIIKRKKLIIIIVTVAVALSILVTMLMPKVFKAQAVIASVQPEGQTGGSPASMLLGSLGLAAPNAASSDVPNLLNSTILRERVIRKYNLLSPLLEEALSFTILPRKEMTDDQKIWVVLSYLKGALIVTSDPATSTIVITMDYKDPAMATGILNAFLQELSDYMAEEGKRVALANKKFLEDQLNSTADPLIKAKIYEMISKQIEKTVMSEVKENSFFKIIDPPKPPVSPYKPKRLLIIAMIFVAALFVGVLVAFIKEHIEKSKAALSKGGE